MDRNYTTSSASPGDGAQPAGNARTAIAFAGFRLEPDGSLFRGHSLIHLPPRELAALQLLLAHAGQIVSSAQIKQALWGDVHVTQESVPRCLSSLRAHLGPADCIQTIYKRGYRLAAEVHRLDGLIADRLPRLAILPFVAGRGVDQHLGAAIAEETIARLSNAREPLASMVARDSVFTLAGRGLTAQQTGQALHADLVLAGTLYSFTSHLRLRAEMIRVSDGIQIWAEDAIAKDSSIEALESDLAARLEFRLQASLRHAGSRFPSSSGAASAGAMETSSAALQSQPTPAAQTQSASRQSFAGSVRGGEGLTIAAAAVSTARTIPIPGAHKSSRREAYEIFLRGHHECHSMERHSMQDGLQHLSRAIHLDPSLLEAKLDLVRLCVIQAGFGYMPPSAANEIARRTAKTIPLEHAEPVLPSLGTLSFHVDHDLATALQEFANSAHLPHDASVTRARVTFTLSRGRFDEGLAQLDAALEHDPFSPWLHARRAWALHLARRHTESLAQMRRCIELFPNHEGVALYGAIILAFNGDAAGGLRVAEALSARMPYFDLITGVHAYTLACANRHAESRALIGRLRWLGGERFVSSSFNAAVYVALGDRENALIELKSSMEMRCPWFFQMLADPRLDPLHDSREFQELRAVLTRMEEAAEASDLEEEFGPGSFSSVGV